MKVPIVFEHQGKTYSGNFQTVMGAGGNNYDHWHLTINGYHRGQLVYSEQKKGWIFSSNSGLFEDLSDYFEFYMVSWFS